LQGEGGVNPGNVEYFQQVRQLCDQHGILLMLDEVQVGMGRTGKLWGYENLGIEPDVFTLAKGLAGGIPIGAMLCKESCNVFEPGDHASTFGGNPFASAAALCVCQTIETECIIENVRSRGEQLREGLRQIAAQYPECISEVRGWGLINGVVLAESLKSIDVVKAAMVEGLLLVPAGPQVVRFVPPLVVSAAEVNQTIDTMNNVLARLCA
ncbi:MAG: aminotransferase class III-fold pyridoxal phosphate-dependent enzyme, partial [Thermosynechococcaceae cyanobacterium]